MAFTPDDKQFLRDLLEMHEQGCDEKINKAIKTHEKRSAAHNPVKAAGILTLVTGAWELAKKFISH